MKLKTILTLLAALGILTACNDDFFDQVPDDRITIEQVFQRTSYSEKYLATVYSYIRDESHRTDGVPWDPCSDDLDVTYDREDYNSFKMNLGNWSASSNYYEYWSHYYRGIRSATYFIQHIGSNQEMLDDPTRGPIVVEQYKNEARFLRAWFYYCLLRQYGPCVLLGRRGASGRPRPRRCEDEPAAQFLRRVRGLHRRRTGRHDRQQPPAAALHRAGRQGLRPGDTGHVHGTQKPRTAAGRQRPVQRQPGLRQRGQHGRQTPFFDPKRTPKSGTRPPRLQKMSSTWEFSTSTRSTTPTERSTLTCPAATFSWRTGTAR